MNNIILSAKEIKSLKELQDYMLTLRTSPSSAKRYELVKQLQNEVTNMINSDLVSTTDINSEVEIVLFSNDYAKITINFLSYDKHTTSTIVQEDVPVALFGLSRLTSKRSTSFSLIMEYMLFIDNVSQPYNIIHYEVKANELILEVC